MKRKCSRNFNTNNTIMYENSLKKYRKAGKEYLFYILCLYKITYLFKSGKPIFSLVSTNFSAQIFASALTLAI